MKKVLMLLQSEFPPDIRLEKEIRTLSKNGFYITLICNEYDSKKSKNFEGVNIIRVKALFKSSKLNYIINFPFILNPRFLYYVIYFGSKVKPDFLHVHDLPMMPFGILLKKIIKRPLIFDMHENYPASLIAFNKTGLLNYLFKNPHLARRLEYFAIKRSDFIITVVKENSERIKKLNYPADKIEVVSNTVDINTYTNSQVDNKILSKYENHKVILYTGGVSPDRGLEVSIKALKYIIAKHNDAKIVIVGNGPSVIHLKNLSKKENVEEYVEFVKWPGHEKLVSYVSAAKVCMITQPGIESNDTTVPHKLFEYMSIGKKIIVSDALPLKRIIQEVNCGTYFKSFDEKDFAKKIDDLFQNSTIDGSNGIKAVNEKYNWAVDGKKLINIYKSFYSGE